MGMLVNVRINYVTFQQLRGPSAWMGEYLCFISSEGLQSEEAVSK